VKGSDRFVLQTNPPVHKYLNCAWGVGVYKLTIKVFAEDTESSEAFVFFNWGGDWDRFDVFDETEWEQQKKMVLAGNPGQIRAR
jgi:hypothetical protein